MQGARAMDVPIDPHTADRFAVHAAELIKWTRRTNLTSITDPLDVAVKHFVDSLAAAPFIPPASRMLDLGSGGGFPGIPLKILIPSLSLTLVDASRKKVSFLNHMIRILELDDARALQVRIEDPPRRSELENTYDVVVCRAFSDLDTFVRKALPLLSSSGRLIALKGSVPASEIETIRTRAIQLPHSPGSEKIDFAVSAKAYVLPFLEAKRTILCFRRRA